MSCSLSLKAQFTSSIDEVLPESPVQVRCIHGEVHIRAQLQRGVKASLGVFGVVGVTRLKIRGDYLPVRALISCRLRQFPTPSSA